MVGVAAGVEGVAGVVVAALVVGVLLLLESSGVVVVEATADGVLGENAEDGDKDAVV